MGPSGRNLCHAVVMPSPSPAAETSRLPTIPWMSYGQPKVSILEYVLTGLLNPSAPIYLQIHQHFSPANKQEERKRTHKQPRPQTPLPLPTPRRNSHNRPPPLPRNRLNHLPPLNKLDLLPPLETPPRRALDVEVLDEGRHRFEVRRDSALGFRVGGGEVDPGRGEAVPDLHLLDTADSGEVEVGPDADACEIRGVSASGWGREGERRGYARVRKATFSAVIELTLLLNLPGGGAQEETLVRGEASRRVILWVDAIGSDAAEAREVS